MKTFLQYVAEDIYRKHAGHLHDTVVVFPNNRARLFFNQALMEVAGKPVWTPRYQSISQLFPLCSSRSLTLADPLRLNGILYQCYRDIFHTDETFDQFYGWGSILLADFDNIDKNCADARQLFRNISEQGEYDDTFEHLTPAQREVIRRFFGHLDLRTPKEGEPTLGRNDTAKSKIRLRFLRLWNQMFRLYSDFQNRLLSMGEAYEGLLYRLCVEDDFQADTFSSDSYIFVGFNALNVCETRLFEKLQRAGKALFYWDYDTFFLNNPQHEAGRFLRENLQRFPNQLDKTIFDTFVKTPKQIHLIASPTETAQAHYAGQWLQNPDFKPSETAIVLCNEGLLLPMLHCIPDEITDLNVTMGYPMSQTPVFNLIRQIVILHSDGYRNHRYRAKYVLPVLQNPYLKTLCPKADEVAADMTRRNLFIIAEEDLFKDEGLSLLFKSVSTPEEMGSLLMEIIRHLTATQKQEAAGDGKDPVENRPGEEVEIFLPLYEESLFQGFTTISHLNDLLKEGLFDMTLTTYRKLLLKLLSTSIPFSGEPLRGIQLMGLLETRNLDFKNVLFLSANEGTIPQKTSDSSFIPYNLRRAFGLTGPEHRDAISSFYFFRFIERAENITCVYNSSTEGLSRGEMSRFLLQLQMESPFDIARSSLGAPLFQESCPSIEVEKSNEVFNRIPHRLSPSAINAYLHCPLQFYFKHVKRLQPEDEIKEEIDGATFGTMFHAAAQHLYTHLMLKKQGKPCSVAAVEDFISRRQDIQQKRLRGKTTEAVPVIRVSVTKDDIEDLKKNRALIEETVLLQFQKEVFKSKDTKSVPLEDFNGEQRIDFKLIRMFLDRLLQLDAGYAPFEILDLEHRIDSDTAFVTPNQTSFYTGGYIDRIDLKGDTIRILDYKTGGQTESAIHMDVLFKSGKNRAKYMLQTFLYASLVREKEQTGKKIKPVLLLIHKALSNNYSSDIRLGEETIDDIRTVEKEFRTQLCDNLDTLFDRDIPFRQCINADLCEYCDFRRICGR